MMSLSRSSCAGDSLPDKGSRSCEGGAANVGACYRMLLSSSGWRMRPSRMRFLRCDLSSHRFLTAIAFAIVCRMPIKRLATGER